MFRHQLPAYSPLTLKGIMWAVGNAGPDALERLETRLCERFDAHSAVLCGSGTQALTLALRAAAPAGRQPLVALPAYACFDLVSAAVGADARLVFYDVVPETLSPDLTSLAEACAEGPDAVVVAHLYGIPVDWAGVQKVVRTCDALLVEDAAQGVGGSYGGRPLGSLGDVSILSFGRGKGWTGGGGGALLGRVEGLFLPQPESGGGSTVRWAARVVAQWALGRPSVYWIPASIPWLKLGETVYHPPVEPEGMSEVSAALVLENEEGALREAAVRRGHAGAVERAVARVGAEGLTSVRGPEEGEPGFLRTPVLAARDTADPPIMGRARSLGIMPGYPRVLTSLEAVSARAALTPRHSGADRLVTQLMTIPAHSLVSRAARMELPDVLSALSRGRDRPAIEGSRQ